MPKYETRKKLEFNVKCLKLRLGKTLLHIISPLTWVGELRTTKVLKKTSTKTFKSFSKLGFKFSKKYFLTAFKVYNPYNVWSLW